jgi:ADP-ribose pyrophosphatase YjhB (NUDIX family)
LSADAASPATLKFRSAGLIVRRQEVLLHRGPEDDFWTLPGGTVEAGERSDEALCREIDEELHIADARAVRLLWVVENRFVYVGRRFHEIGFYWLLDVPERAWSEQIWPDHGGEFEMAEPHIVFRWAALSDLAAIDIKPGFLRHGIAVLPAATTYLQVDE